MGAVVDEEVWWMGRCGGWGGMVDGKCGRWGGVVDGRCDGWGGVMDGRCGWEVWWREV